MSRIPLRFWVLASVLCLLNVAGLLWIRAEVIAGQRRVRVLTALPARDVDAADRFALLFDEPCVEAQLVGQPLDRAPFTLTPVLAGRWTWAAPERLEFRIEKPLPPGRVFTLRAAPDAEAVLGRRLTGGTEFRFQTRALELRDWDFAGADRTHATFELHFNQPVSPAELLRLMQVTDRDGRQKLEATVLTAEPAETLVIRTVRPPQDEVRIVLDERLTGHNAELQLGSPVVRQLKIVPLFALLRAEVTHPELERDVEVTLYFSRELNDTQSPPAVNVSPQVENLHARLAWDRLVLTGPFESNHRYTATVPSTLLSRQDETLGEPQSVSFEIPEREPAVSFPLSEGILSPAGNEAVEVEVVNLGAVRLRAVRLHANNLVAALHSTHHLEHTHRQLPEKTVPLKLVRNVPTKLLVDLRGLVDQPHGVFHVEAASPDHEWTNDAAVIMLTDLGLTVKQGRDGILAWVTSLRSAQSVAGATVVALSQNNQVLARGTTDADGIARLPVPEKHPDGPVWLVTAEREGDLSFLRPEQRPWVLDDVDQSGRPAPTTYDVLLYAERGVYRPGDTVHLTGIVRDTSGQIPPAFPLTVRITRPDGRKVADLPASFEPSGQGLFHCDYATREDGQLGRYRCAVTLPGAEEVLGQTKVLVEEFVPVRMAVTAEPTQTRFGPEQTPEVYVAARYLFGQPAAGLPLTVVGEFRRAAFKSARFPQFAFADGQRTETWKPPEIKAELDANGTAVVKLAAPDSPGRGLWEGGLAATITEPGGRSVSANLTVWVDTADRHIGLRLPAGNVIALDNPAQAECVFVSGDDEPSSGELEFELERVEYDSAIEIVNQRPTWKSVERLIPVWNRALAAQAGGPMALDLNVRDPGHYRLRGTRAGTNSTTVLDFYAAANVAEAQTLALNRPERLELVLDRDDYAPGSTAKVLVRSPFPGSLLLTLESDRVLDHRLVPVPASTAEIELPVPVTLRGGAFVSATLVRAVDPAQDKWLPHRAIGLARLVSDHPAQQLPVTIVAPPSARPGTPVTVRIETQPLRPTSLPATQPTTAPTSSAVARAPAQAVETQPTAISAPVPPPAVVHLWAVDEGILRTAAYATPNPHGHFFAKRELQVASADVFGDLLPDYHRPASMARIGGDSGEEEMLRRSPVPTRRQAPAVLWRIAAPVGPDGTLTVPLDLPKTTGEIRLMAVVVDGDRYGATQRPITLTTPLLVEAAWPRFVAPDDRFQVPVKLFNNSDAPFAATLELEVSGPLQLEPAQDERTVTVEPGKPYTLWLAATSTGLGLVDASVTARATTAAGESLAETSTASFPVRPIAPLHAETAFLRLEAGRESALELPGAYLPGTERVSLMIGGQPQVELLPALDQLLEYPYGCVEQTTSRLYAMLHAPELLAAHSEGSGRIQQVRGMIEAGLLRLWSMQTRDGGISYWPGGQHSDLWPSAYVGHFLLAARRSGYTPEPRFVEELLKYLKARLYASEEEVDYGTRVEDNTRALICCVLAGFGQPQDGWQARLAERLDRLDMAGRALLAATWLETGHRDRALAALPPDTIELSVTDATGGRITSLVQQEATLLGVLLELDREHPWIPVLVRKLEAARTGGHWMNTLENAMALAALTRYQLLGPQPGTFNGQVLFGGQQRLAFDSQQPAMLRFALGGEPVRLTSNGTGNIFVTVQTHGLAIAGDLAPFDRQLQVRRYWTDRAGTAIDPAELHVGDLVYVKVTLAAPGLGRGGTIQNVAIVDPLPGGLEVEHPKLATSVHRKPGPDEGDEPDRVEFRDDRVILFTPAEAKERTFRYALRVITAGRFAIPPIEATCMYDPGLASRYGGGTLEVQR